MKFLKQFFPSTGTGLLGHSWKWGKCNGKLCVILDSWMASGKGPAPLPDRYPGSPIDTTNIGTENSSLSPVGNRDEAATNHHCSWELKQRTLKVQSLLPEMISIAVKANHGSNDGTGNVAFLHLLTWFCCLNTLFWQPKLTLPKAVLHYSIAYCSSTLLSPEILAFSKCLFAIFLKQCHWKL